MHSFQPDVVHTHANLSGVASILELWSLTILLSPDSPSVRLPCSHHCQQSRAEQINAHNGASRLGLSDYIPEHQSVETSTIDFAILGPILLQGTRSTVPQLGGTFTQDLVDEVCSALIIEIRLKFNLSSENSWTIKLRLIHCSTTQMRRISSRTNLQKKASPVLTSVMKGCKGKHDPEASELHNLKGQSSLSHLSLERSITVVFLSMEILERNGAGTASCSNRCALFDQLESIIASHYQL